MTVFVFHSDVLGFMMNRQPIHPAQVSPVPNGSLVPSVAKFLLSTPSSPPCTGILDLLSFGPCMWLFRDYYYGSPTQLLFSSLILTFTTTLLHHGTKVDSDYRLFPCNRGILWKFLPLHLADISMGSSWTSETQISVWKNNLLLPANSSYPWQFPSGAKASWAREDTVEKTYTVD